MMALAKVPIVPQWGLSDGCVATADGGLLYIGSRTINYIAKIEKDTPPVIKVFHTRQHIMSLAVDPDWSADDAQLRQFAVLAQDTSIQIWDFDKGCAISGHKAHCTKISVEGNGPAANCKILLGYMCNRNVLSICSADIVVYCVASNSYYRKATFISTRNQQITVMRCSPHNEHIFAVGTNRGLVLVCDLQTMSILYTLRGHDAAISALSWIMVDLQALPPKPAKTPTKVVEKKQRALNAASPAAAVTTAKSAASIFAASDEIFDIYDYDYLENEFGAPCNDDKNKGDALDFVGLEKPVESATISKFDFVEACQSLREEIDAMKDEQSPGAGEEVTLNDCQQQEQKIKAPVSSCGDEEDEQESTEGSLELLCHSSDDDVNVDGAEPKVVKALSGSLMAENKQIVHKADVHSAQTMDKSAEQTAEQLAEKPAEQIMEQPKEKLPVTVEKHAEQAVEQATVSSAISLPEIAKEAARPDMGRDILLASASIDATFWVWNAETGASCDQLRARNTGQHGKNSHIEITWLNANTFLTTNRTGDITSWSMLPSEQVRRYKFKEDKRQFLTRGVVSFAICKDLIWTISSYREISCENIVTKTLVAKYCCASTNIAVMRECPDDMNKIALGFSDRRIGIIDISKLSATNVTIENFSQRIDSPVLSLVWNADCKKLAFGTIEGRVGIINVENLKLLPFTFNPFCGKPIYSIDWKNNYIFVCCNEKLAVYEDNMNCKDAFVIQSITSVSAISVRNNYLFVGTQRGNMRVYRQRPQPRGLAYDLLQEIELAPRYITDIAWSPIANDTFAVISMANKIHILNFNPGNQTVQQVRKIEIKNAKAANACVKWSNRNASNLLTCGFDGAIRVWDLASGANSDNEKFLKQFCCPMTCGLFLPTDENIIICAGKSTSVELFNMTLQKSEDFSTAKWKRYQSNTLEHVQWALKMNPRPETKSSTAAEKRRQRREKGADAENGSEFSAESSDGHTTVALNGNGVRHNGKTEEISNMLDSLKIAETVTKTDVHNTHKCAEICTAGSVFMRNPTTLLYLTTKEINKDALEKLNSILGQTSGKQPENAAITAKLFNSKLVAKELLEEELRNHQKSETKGIASLLMPQIRMNIKDEILKCIQTKQLNEWHVSLAPTISYNFWQKCCQAFAEQLLEQGYALQAATYMTALHNQTEAILVLIEKQYFKEALLMARVYLQPDDPLLNIIIDKWISYLDFTGNLAGAALLCSLSGQMNRAYDILSKVRNTHPDIERALRLLQTNDKFH